MGHQGRRMEAVLIALLCTAVLTSCGSTKALVKKERSPGEKVPAELSCAAVAKDSRSENAVKPCAYPPIPLEEDAPRLRRFIREYAYRNRESMRRYLARAEKFLPMVRQAARDNQLPDEIAYLFMLESGADPGARSPANALGMWQFMPATARNYGLRVDSWVDERLDPEKSTRAAMLYLKDLYGMFGCWRLALSAYNSGENKLNRVLAQEDAHEYAEICSSRRLKRETREFWPRFLAIAHIVRNPEKYGFEPVRPYADDGDYVIAPVKGSYSLATLAHLADVPVNDLAESNPSLIRGMTPPRGAPFQLKVPRSAAKLVAQRLKYTPTDDPGEGHTTHVIARGETLGRLLRRYQVSRTELCNLNPDINFRKGRLRAGDRIVVPIAESTPAGNRAKERRRVSMLTSES